MAEEAPSRKKSHRFRWKHPALFSLNHAAFKREEEIGDLERLTKCRDPRRGSEGGAVHL